MLALVALALSLAPLASGVAIPPGSAPASAPRVPSIYESTVQARRILQLQGLGTMSTVFPSVRTLEQRPDAVQHAPIGLMEYYAACGPEAYNPSIIGVSIATSMKNAAAGSNVTLSLRYELPLDAPQPPPDPWAYLPANLPRFALVGYLERLDEQEDKEVKKIKDCFLRRHPESTIWMPGTDIHESWWGRLVVNEVYFFGGFGDRARIAWLPIEHWRGIPQHIVDDYRLVGEEGYGEVQRSWWRARYEPEELEQQQSGQQQVLGQEL